MKEGSLCSAQREFQELDKKIRVTKRASGLYLGLEEKDERLHWSGH